jgi:hypothetical protein
MEEKRLPVSEGEITIYFERLAEAIDRVQAHFAYNLDEMGYQEWVDGQERIGCVSSAQGKSHHMYTSRSHDRGNASLSLDIAAPMDPSLRCSLFYPDEPTIAISL